MKSTLCCCCCSRNSRSSCSFYSSLHFQLDTTNWLRIANRTKTRLRAATFLKRKFAQAQAQAATPALSLALTLTLSLSSTLTLTPSLLTIQKFASRRQVNESKQRERRVQSEERASAVCCALVVLSPLASLLVSIRAHVRARVLRVCFGQRLLCRCCFFLFVLRLLCCCCCCRCFFLSARFN